MAEVTTVAAAAPSPGAKAPRRAADLSAGEVRELRQRYHDARTSGRRLPLHRLGAEYGLSYHVAQAVTSGRSRSEVGGPLVRVRPVRWPGATTGKFGRERSDVPPPELTVRQRHLFARNVRLTGWVLKHVCASQTQRLMSQFHVEWQELEQLALIGLMEAARSFDAARGLKFSTYYVAAMRSRLAREVHLRVRQRECEVQVVTRTMFAPGHTGHGNGEEVEGNVTDIASAPGRGAFTAGPGDPAEATERDEQAELLRAAVERLEPRERLVVELRYGLTTGGARWTLDQIGHMIGISKECVRQVEIGALAKLKGVLA